MANSVDSGWSLEDRFEHLQQLARQRKLKKPERLDYLEAVVVQRGWSLVVAAEVAEELSCGRRTVERDYTEVVERLRKLEEAGREDRRAMFLARLRLREQKAEDADKWGPVSTMMTLESRLLGLDVPPPEKDLEEDLDLDEDDELELAKARHRRIRAAIRDSQSRGSMVAATKLMEHEGQAIDAIREIKQQRREAEFLDMTDEELIEGMAADVESLPDSMREALLERLAQLDRPAEGDGSADDDDDDDGEPE